MPWSSIWPAIADALIAGIIRWMVPGTRVPPMILWFPTREFRGMDLLLPLIHVGLFGSWHHVGSRWASSGVSIWPSLLDKGTRNKECAVTETDKKVSTWVHKLSTQSMSVLRNYVEPLSTPTPSFCAQWMEKKTRTTLKHQSVTVSTCPGHGSELLKLKAE